MPAEAVPVTVSTALMLSGSDSASFFRLYPPINMISMPSIHFVFSCDDGAISRRLTPPSHTTRKERPAVSASTLWCS